MGHEFQHISAGTYFHEHGMFFELGGHFSRCEPPELLIMQSQYKYAEQVRDGTAAYVSSMPSASILKLANTLRPYPMLWDAFKEGFINGLDNRFVPDAQKPFDQKDLAVLALKLSTDNELNSLFQDRLAAHGMKILIREQKKSWPDETGYILVMTPGPTGKPVVYTTERGEFTSKDKVADLLKAIGLADSIPS